MTKPSKHISYLLCALLVFGVLFVTPQTIAAEKTPPFFEKKEAPAPKLPARTEPKPQKGGVYGLLAERGFATQEYVVKEGDWLTKILREKGVLEDYDPDELLRILRQLNESLKNINIIRPGEKIVILVKVTPKAEAPRKPAYETYTIKPGDSLYQLALERYGLTDKTFMRQYIPLLKKYNPEITNLDLVRPGQKIRLPIYPRPPAVETARKSATPSQHFERDLDTNGRVALVEPRVVNRAFNPPSAAPFESKAETPPPPEAAGPMESLKRPGAPEASPLPKAEDMLPYQRIRGIEPGDQGIVIVLADGMGDIFRGMGEEWVDKGEHFIPMPSGGQINLKAENYPILRLHRGATVIVDLSSTLPRKMVDLIESTWPGYRVVPIVPRDDLRSALGKILRACTYDRVFKRGEPLELGGSVRVKITGDWIVALPASEEAKAPRFVVISLIGPQNPPLPETIKEYLKLMGVEVLEYPPVNRKDAPAPGVKEVKKAADTPSLIETVLNLTGRPHTMDREMAAFKTQKDDFELTIKADFYLKNGKKGAIIDVNGLDPKVISLLKERGVDVLSLARETKLLPALEKLLKFLRIQHKDGPLTFAAVPGKGPTNVRLTLKGIVFQSSDGDSVIATGASLPSEVVRFLAQKGYRVLVLKESASGKGHHA